MIITCPNCKKKFEVNTNLIPADGRNLQCGLCKKVWFYKIEKQDTEPLTLSENKFIVENESKSAEIETSDSLVKKKSINSEKINRNEKVKKPIKKFNIIGKIFSYLIVFIISFMALIILIDTFKTPLINIFPNIELILYNLFETLKDIKLFIIDLS